MGLFGSWNENKARRRAAFAATKADIEAQTGAAIANMQADSERRIAGMNQAHRADLAPLKAEIARQEASLRKAQEYFHIDNAFTALESALIFPLLANIDYENNFADATRTIQGEIKGKVAALKGGFSPGAVSQLENWALSRTHDNKKEKVLKAFKEFRATLRKHGVVV